MAANYREFVMVVQESAYNTPVGSPTVWTTSTTYGLSNFTALYPRLDGDNACTLRPRPTMVETMVGGGVAIPYTQTSDKIPCTGQLRMKLSIAQAPFWLSWLGVPFNGSTTPWSYTGLTGDLCSCSLYHGIMRADGTIKRRLYTGVKCAGGQISMSEGSTVMTLSLNLIASQPQGSTYNSTSDPSAGTFPVPADNNLPSDWFTFVTLGGTNYFKYMGAYRTQMTEMNINITNSLSQYYYANRFLQVLQYMGRRTTIATKLAYPPSSQDDRTNYETLAAAATTVECNNGTHGWTLTANAQNMLTAFEDDLVMKEIYFQPSTQLNQWDPAQGSDFTIAFS